MFGPFVATGCALSWAIAIVFWRRGGTDVHAFALNVFKNGFALLLILPTLYFVEGTFSTAILPEDFWLLVLSGTIGIGISDALYLWSLNIIGASRLAIIDCIYAPSIMFLAWIILGEALTPIELLGAALVISAVFLVTHEKSTSVLERKLLLKGTFVCVFAIVSMAGGILMIKPIFARVPLFFVITLRLIAGFVSSFLITLAHKDRRRIFTSLLQAKHKNQIILASFFGTYVSMVCWVAGFKYNQASIAAVLNQTTTFFTVVFAALFLGEPLTRRKVLATLIAFCGVLMITFKS